VMAIWFLNCYQPMYDLIIDYPIAFLTINP